ncbi:MAG: inorganic phosphate transporter [Solirubrobacterales bacterium]|nr:inorganic phosphate transporter [Solirubrobacterales bacterium]
MEAAGLVAVIAVALVFNYTTGFHDAANAIATSVSTRALTPRLALGLAAAGNLAGALLGTGVALTVTAGIIQAPPGGEGLVILLAALIGAIGWNLTTWYFGPPASSSHALIGGMVGAALAASAGVIWGGVLHKVVFPMVLSPIVGLLLGYAVMIALLWLCRRADPHAAGRRFRVAQTFSAGAMAVGHGLQDAQKTMGIIVLALVTCGIQEDASVPLWVIVATAATLALGTYAGGWRVMRTLGRGIIELDPPQGFAAELTASSVLYATSSLLHAPISTTHVITTSIMGVGSTRRRSAVRWGVAGNIAVAWLLTLPIAAALAAASYLALHAIITL